MASTTLTNPRRGLIAGVDVGGAELRQSPGKDQKSAVRRFAQGALGTRYTDQTLKSVVQQLL